MSAPMIADYAPAQDQCSERGRNLRLGQTVAPGCEQWAPRTGGTSSEDARDRRAGVFDIGLGAAAFSPRDASPWLLGPTGSVGIAYRASWFDVGAVTSGTW